MPDAGAATSTTATALPGHTGRTRRGRGRARPTPTPLGPLPLREHDAVIACRSCGSTRVRRLSLNLTDGTPVEFTSCHRCEHRTWEHAGAVLTVGSVLDRASR